MSARRSRDVPQARATRYTAPLADLEGAPAQRGLLVVASVNPGDGREDPQWVAP